MEITQELKNLFKQVRVQLGHPVRRIEISDDEMCELLDVAVGNYYEVVNNWVIQSNWLNMNGKSINYLQNSQDLVHAFTMRNLDFSRDMSYWFSKEVGLQQRGNGEYELKKDFIEIEKGKQCYVIPAGREINKVLYVTPPTTKTALYGLNGALDAGAGLGHAQIGNANAFNYGMTSFYVGNMYDVALMSSAISYRNSFFRGDLSYKITQMKDGSHILHLLSTPGSPNTLSGSVADDSWGWNQYCGHIVWYTYYDVSGYSEDEVNECRIKNADDILITPDQVPLSQLSYPMMNDASKATIRRLLVAEVAQTLAFIRGYASGTISIPNATMQLDYQMLIDYSRNEKEKVMSELKERLESMLPWNQLRNQADMAESNMKILGYKPLGLYVK
ncbi:MAG: hypothetical protein IKT40_05920 [Bacilli bacterium]|nr:hypothetical protein [Bacilli bacterium]